MNWRWVKAFPKFALVFVVLVGSTVAFGIWWFMFRTPKSTIQSSNPIRATTPVEDIGPKLALVEAKHDRLILVDNDLYDLDTGAVIFKHWLEKDMPERLFYDGDTKKLIAQYELGFVRYNLKGTAEATLLQRFKPAISADRKWMLYVKDKDIWRADIDWSEFRLVNDRKLTSIEQFFEQNFAENIMFWTDKTLIVRNLSTLLRVNLETGDVKQLRISLDGIAKRRSPDSKSLVGLQGGQFYCYDVDSDAAKTIPVGRGAINDYQWLGNDKCVAIAAMKTVIQYDRVKRSLTIASTLPVQCNRIGEPSPDGKFVFCYSWKGAALVDLEKRTATPFTGGAGVKWINNDTVIFSRDVPDSVLRGTWFQHPGEGDRRVSSEPYLVSGVGGFVLQVPAAGTLVFATRNGLSKMKVDSAESTELVNLVRPPIRLVRIEEWNYQPPR